jgi:hypothetical protein
MPANTIFSTLTTPPIRLANGRLDTRPGYRGGVAPGTGPVGLLFSENFDDQADWNPEINGAAEATFRWDGATMPAGWDAAYNGNNFYSTNGSIRISAADSADAFGGNGKCLKCFREHHFDAGFPNQFNSNGVLGKLLATGLSEIYVEFLIKFDPNWTYDAGSATSKIFRVFSSPGEITEFWQAFGGGSQGPLFLWDWADDSSFGVRNVLSFRGGPIGDNYNARTYADPFMSGLGRGLAGLGDASMNWTSDLQGTLQGGGTPQIPDKVNGGFLPASGNTSHPQIFGPAGTWTKLGFQLKMNSAPNEPDGIFRQFLNDQLIVDSTDVRWVGPTSEAMRTWNALSFGGNDFWNQSGFVNADEREEWYVIDEIKIRDSLPEGLI